MTAQNDAGKSVTTFQLKSGIILSYTCGETLTGDVGKPIETCELSIENAPIETSPSIPYTLTGNLFVLTFDNLTGRISGIPTSTGSDTLHITGTYSDASISASISLPITIHKTKTFAHKTAYLASASAGIGVGADHIVGSNRDQ